MGRKTQDIILLSIPHVFSFFFFFNMLTLFEILIFFFFSQYAKINPPEIFHIESFPKINPRGIC